MDIHLTLRGRRYRLDPARYFADLDPASEAAPRPLRSPDADVLIDHLARLGLLPSGADEET